MRTEPASSQRAPASAAVAAAILLLAGLPPSAAAAPPSATRTPAAASGPSKDAAAPAPAGAARPMALDDLQALRDVSDPDLSPDGAWVAYSVAFVDAKRDRYDSDIYMTSWDGKTTLRMTSRPEREHEPRFSPDGRYLGFLSKRDTKSKSAQVWIMNRAGGEAERVTDIKGGVTDYAWSPDGRRLAVVADDPDPDEDDAEEAKGDDSKGDDAPAKTPKPIVIDRFQFKQDEEGYLRTARSHLYLVDVETRRAEQITSGPHDEHLPAWSPDGARLAYVTKRGDDPDRTDNWDLYVIEARAGGLERRLTDNDLDDGDPSWEGGPPAWSPDGKWIAYLGGGPQKQIYYAGYHLMVIPAEGGAPRRVLPKLDRNMTHPRWSQGGSTLTFLLEDDGSVHLERVATIGSNQTTLLGGRHTTSGYALGADGRIAVLDSTPGAPAEVYALEKETTRRPLSRQNDALLSRLRLATTEDLSYKSKDGTEIHGFAVKPPDFKPGPRYPTILTIHGGPVSQYQNEWDFEWQLLAAHGYVVAAANPRGSSGRGEAFSLAIYADWGTHDGEDVRGAIDHLIAAGVADPDRLGVGGWSYGAILTNYVITQDQRFKAATSGAGISDILAGYGTDEYVREYEAELGPPWKAAEVYVRLSSPFLHADRITTPTLFLCGDKDFNVPLLNSEQMYQALRSLGRDTELVIYPGEYHGIDTPSYIKDRLQRYLDWFDRHLKK